MTEFREFWTRDEPKELKEPKDLMEPIEHTKLNSFLRFTSS